MQLAAFEKKRGVPGVFFDSFGDCGDLFVKLAVSPNPAGQQGTDDYREKDPANRFHWAIKAERQLSSKFEDFPHLDTVDHAIYVGSLAGGQYFAQSPNSRSKVLLKTGT